MLEAPITEPKDVEKVTIGSDLLDAFHEMQFWPGEDKAIFKSLQEEMLTDLGFAAPYERSLVENIIQLEWEPRRMRTMRARLLREAFKRQAAAAYYMHKVKMIDVLQNNPEASQFADDLLHSDPAHHKPAREILDAMGLTHDDLNARAYSDIAPTLEHFERQIADAEPRRRLLRDELEDVRAGAAKTIDSALELSKDAW